LQAGKRLFHNLSLLSFPFTRIHKKG
jgi:hypothetical protein